MVWLLAALVPEREPELEPGLVPELEPESALEPERVLELAQGLDCYMLRVILIIPA